MRQGCEKKFLSPCCISVLPTTVDYRLIRARGENVGKEDIGVRCHTVQAISPSSADQLEDDIGWRTPSFATVGVARDGD
jgi:hypothetical protein